jgi:hypothetical protein
MNQVCDVAYVKELEKGFLNDQVFQGGWLQQEVVERLKVESHIYNYHTGKNVAVDKPFTST